MTLTEKLERAWDFAKDTYERATDWDEIGRRMAKYAYVPVDPYDDEMTPHLPTGPFYEDEGQED